jgi:hypothetical protein
LDGKADPCHGGFSAVDLGQACCLNH